MLYCTVLGIGLIGRRFLESSGGRLFPVRGLLEEHVDRLPRPPSSIKGPNSEAQRGLYFVLILWLCSNLFLFAKGPLQNDRFFPVSGRFYPRRRSERAWWQLDVLAVEFRLFALFDAVNEQSFSDCSGASLSLCHFGNWSEPDFRGVNVPHCPFLQPALWTRSQTAGHWVDKLACTCILEYFGCAMWKRLLSFLSLA